VLLGCVVIVRDFMEFNAEWNSEVRSFGGILLSTLVCASIRDGEGVGLCFVYMGLYVC
jgi:hypothetical protein